VLIRREQIDELDDSASNILHELCYFETDSSHSECLGSVILEEVVRFEVGADSGLPEHEKPSFAAKRKLQKEEKKNQSNAGLVDSLIMLLKNSEVDELEDYTILLSLPTRQLRLRAETKTNFDSWVSILSTKIPLIRAKIMYEGWMWRRMSVGGFGVWQQRYALIYEGVLYFFVTKDNADKFKLLAARDADSVFLASQVSEDMLSLEYCELTRHDIWEDRDWVLKFKVEEHVELGSVVDEANATAWVLAVRNARHWFEKIPDEHPTRKLVGGTNANEEDGPMIEQNVNPLAAAHTESHETKEETAAAEAAAAEKARLKEEKRQARREQRRQRRAADAESDYSSRTPRDIEDEPIEAEPESEPAQQQQQQLQLMSASPQSMAQSPMMMPDQMNLSAIMGQQMMAPQMVMGPNGMMMMVQPQSRQQSMAMAVQQQIQMQQMQQMMAQQMMAQQMGQPQAGQSPMMGSAQMLASPPPMQQSSSRQASLNPFMQPAPLQRAPSSSNPMFGSPMMQPQSAMSPMSAPSAEPRHPSIKPIGAAVPGVRATSHVGNLDGQSMEANSKIPAGLLPFLSVPAEGSA
jgi:hypothetical protein